MDNIRNSCDVCWPFRNFWQFWQILTIFDNFWKFLKIFDNVFRFAESFQIFGEFLWPETWHLRHWLHFWQLRTTIWTITLWPLNREWWWQHSQFLRCFYIGKISRDKNLHPNACKSRQNGFCDKIVWIMLFSKHSFLCLTTLNVKLHTKCRITHYKCDKYEVCLL